MGQEMQETHTLLLSQVGRCDSISVGQEGECSTVLQCYSATRVSGSS